MLGIDDVSLFWLVVISRGGKKLSMDVADVDGCGGTASGV